MIQYENESMIIVFKSLLILLFCIFDISLFLIFLYWVNRPISIMASVFAIGPGKQGSIPGRIISINQKMVLDTYLLDTQHYKVRIKGKWSNPGKGVEAIEKGVFVSPSTTLGRLN